MLRYKAISLASDVRQNIAGSNWNEIFCFLNAIESCDYYKPILIVNDKNFGKENLNDFFQALQVVKNTGTTGKSHFPTRKPLFPIILETSDNIWMEGLHSGTSNSAFQFYYLEPMTYLEGKHAMVMKFEMFDEKTYEYLYTIFRGHIRFYIYYWKWRLFYDQPIKKLSANSRIIMASCLMHADNEKVQIKTLLQDMRDKNYNLTEVYFLSDTVKQLIGCNLLFYNAEKFYLMVQNALLEQCIDNFLDSQH